MLDSIRKRKDNLVYSILVLLVVAVMAMYGIGKMGNDESGSGTAAWVNGELITRAEFQRELERRLNQYQAMLGAQYDEKLLMQLQVPQKTLEELVQYKLLSQQAKKMNVIVPDSELADHIRSLPYFQKEGKFNATLYNKLPNRGIEERWQRERLQISKLQNHLMNRIRVTPEETKRTFLLKETKIDLEYAKIDFSELASKHQPSKVEVAAYLKAGNEPTLKEYYDSHRSEFVDKATVDLRQIRVSVPYQASESQKASAKTKINQIATEVTPNNFSEVAKKQSDDEYAKKGGNVGTVIRGSLDSALEKTIDSLSVNQVSAPIETSYGFFLLQVLQKKEEVVHPLEEVKQTIAGKKVLEAYKKQFAEDKQKEWDKILASSQSLEGELRKWNIERKKTGLFSLGQGQIPNIGNGDALLDAAFELAPSSPVAKKLIPNQNHFFFLKLVTANRAKEKDLSKNRETIEKGIENSLQGELFGQWIAQMQKGANIKTELNFGSTNPGGFPVGVN